VRPGAPRRFVQIVHSSQEFPTGVEAAFAPEAIDDALGELVDLGVRLYRSHAPRQPLVFLHTVTAPAALALIVPHVPRDVQRSALAYLWQATAAWVAAYSDGQPLASLDVEAPAFPVQELVDRAVATREVHAIKFTEACTRLFRQRGEPAYVAAAADWCMRVERATTWTNDERVAAGMKFD
jgi:hypothetical protein